MISLSKKNKDALIITAALILLVLNLIFTQLNQPPEDQPKLGGRTYTGTQPLPPPPIMTWKQIAAATLITLNTLYLAFTCAKLTDD